MAKISLIAKSMRPQKFAVREYTRCRECGRVHAVYQKFGLCRLCLRKHALQGEVPGMAKASW